MAYKLRPYQQEAVDTAVRLLSSDKPKPFVIQAATGAGKSVIIAEICRAIDKKIIILQPSKELVEQNHAKLKSYGVTDIAIYSASLNSKEVAKFTYATIGSIISAPELFKDVYAVLVDECHLVNPEKGQYKKFLKAIGCERVCGLSATPYRIVQRYQHSGNMVFSVSLLRVITRIRPAYWKGGIQYKIETKELISQGFLCPIDYKLYKISLDELKVNSTGADYTTQSLDIFWNDERIMYMAQLIDRIEKEGKFKRSLVFCTSILQAERLQKCLASFDIKASLVTGTTPKRERESFVREYREGKVRHMLNVGVFTTGFDVPELDTIIMARPTMSLALYYQCLGRGIRIDPQNPSKRLTFHDMSGVVKRLGRVEEIRVMRPQGGGGDTVITNVGVVSEKPLFYFQIPGKASE